MTATTWRDFGLTEKQIAELERLDGYEYERKPATLARVVAEFVELNRLQARLADVPHPVGAVAVDDWMNDDGQVRQWRGMARTIPAHRDEHLNWVTANDETVVQVTGMQRPDGSVKREIHLATGSDTGEFFDIDTAAMVAEALGAAVAEARADQAREQGDSAVVFSEATR